MIKMKSCSIKNLAVNKMKREGMLTKNWNQGPVRSGMNTRSRVRKSVTATTNLKETFPKYIMIYFLLFSFMAAAGFSIFVKTKDELWDESDIMNQADETVAYEKLIGSRMLYQPKKTTNNAADIESFRQLNNDEMPENYTEYKGLLHCGSLIKARLCSELVYLKNLLDHSEPAGLIKGLYDEMYNAHIPDVETIKKDTNYEEIKKNVTELVDQISKGDESGQTVRQKEFIQNIKALQDPLKSTCDMGAITKEANNAIDELLDCFHDNLPIFKDLIATFKIWTLKGFITLLVGKMNNHNLNIEPKLHKTFEGVISNEMRKMTNNRIQNRVDSIVQWISLFPTDDWTCLKRREVPSHAVSTVLVYGEASSEDDYITGIHMYPQIQKNLSEDEIRELARPTRKTKREHKEWFVESLSLLLTEGTHLFQTRQIKFHTRLNTILQALIREGFQIKPSLEK